MMSNNERIELKRLCKIVNEDSSKYDILSFYGSKPLSDLFGGDLEWNILILLGDKGSGKTTEIQHLAEQKKDISFFSSLDNYYKNPTKIEDKVKFAFFDSIDEFYLLFKDSDKEEAFLNILQIIKNNIPKNCKMVFTCRESDFSFDKTKIIENIFTIKTIKRKDNESDLSNLAQKENPTQTNDDKPVVEVYNLLPLDNEMIKRLCHIYMPSQASSFLLEKENATIHEEFFETPVECIDTIKFYQRYGGLPKESYRELMDFLQHKLYFRYRELNQAHSNNLTLQKIKTLSQRIAIINSLTNTPSIIKEENYNTQKEQIQTSVDLSIMNIFPEESCDTLKNYINSTLFSSNGINRVKFYNETIRHYLAYLWLKERFAKHTYKKIKTIIFNNINDIAHPKESLIIPIIMLSTDEYRIKKILIEQRPDLLMRFSHYANLNIADKKLIFNNLMKKFQYRLLSFTPYSSPDEKIGLRAFSDPALLDEYITYYPTCEFQGKYILLYLINSLKKEEIKGDKLINLLWKILKNNNEDLAHLSLKTLLKQEDNFLRVANFFKSGSKPIDEYLLDALINKLYPTYLSLADIVQLLNSFKKDEGRIRVITISDIIKNFSKENLKNKDSLINLLNLIKDSKKEQDHIVIIYINLLIQFLEKYPDTNNDSIDYLLDLQKFLTAHRYDNINSNISKSIEILRKKIDTDLNLTLLSKISENFIQENKIDQLNEMLYMNYPDEQRLYSIDLNNISIRDLFLSLSKDDRLQENEQKDLLRHIWRGFSSDIDQGSKVDFFTDYCNTPSKKELLQNLINPPSYEESSEIIKMREQSQKIREAREELNEKNKEYIGRNIELIKSGDEQIFNVLLDFALRHHGHGLGEIDATEIEKEFGTDIKDAYILGLKNYWQNCQFNIADYLKQSETSILNQAVVALPGVNLSFSDPNFNLTSDLAKKTIYFGIQELNDLPAWFNKVILEYPKEALVILKPVIEHTLKTSKNRFGIFTKIQRLDKNSLSTISIPLWELIQTHHKNIDDDVLQVALECLNNIDININEKIITIIQSRIQDKKNTKVISWLTLLFDYDIDLFIEYLEKMKLQKDDKFFINVFANLYEYGNLTYNNKLKKIISLDQLIKLLIIVFKYAPPETDPQHPSGISFSPSQRDDVASIRRELFSLIDQYQSSRHNILKIKEFANTINNPIYKSLLLIKADNLIYKDISEHKFSEHEIISLEEGDFIMPNSSGALFNIVVANLEDIKENIEKGDHSIRDLYINLKNSNLDASIKEKHFQKYILMEMRAESKNLYSSVRESEVDDDKRPDLQIWEQNFCTTVECKIANAWSYNDLKTAVTEQLVGKYLKHSMYEYGILLLFNTDENRKWNSNEKRGLDFDNLIEQLQCIANEQYKIFEHLKKIKVIGIKFYDKEKKQKNC